MPDTPSTPDSQGFAENDSGGAEADDLGSPACVLAFNANDPSGAGGLSADIGAIASVGAHALAVATGAYARDSAEVFDHFCLGDEAVSEQARVVLEDVQVQVFKVGFVGSPENLGVIAGIASDYADTPLVAYMPNLAWWDERRIDEYLDAFGELLLPQTSVLVGSYGTLSRWLLPDWNGERSPSARDIAGAASAMGASYTLVTGISVGEQHIDNVLATAHQVVASVRFERFDAVFSGAGDTLSAALAALLAGGDDIETATREALSYLDRCLDGGFRPGMGHVLPDRMFWAQIDADSDSDGAAPSIEPPATAESFGMPPSDTRH